MTKKIELKAYSRTAEEKPAAVRKNNYIPAIVYGTSIEPKSIKIKKQELDKVYNEAGESTLIDLIIDDSAAVKVIIKDVQSHIVKNEKIHLDLHMVDMKKTITTEIPINYIGTSKAEKELGAVLIKNLHDLEIECLPGDLVNHIDIDLSKLVNFNDHIQVRDIDLGSSIKILNDPDNVVVSVTERVEEVEPEPVAESETKESEAKKEDAQDDKKEDKK